MNPSGSLCKAIARQVCRPMERKALVGTWWWCSTLSGSAEGSEDEGVCGREDARSPLGMC